MSDATPLFFAFPGTIVGHQLVTRTRALVFVRIEDVDIEDVAKSTFPLEVPVESLKFYPLGRRVSIRLEPV